MRAGLALLQAGFRKRHQHGASIPTEDRVLTGSKEFLRPFLILFFQSHMPDKCEVFPASNWQGKNLRAQGPPFTGLTTMQPSSSFPSYRTTWVQPL